MTDIFRGNGSKVTDGGLAAAARQAGIKPRALRAVLQVETNGRPWDKQGRLAMLFEPHVFYKHLKGSASAGALATAINEKLAYEHQGTYPYPSDSYPHFEAAYQLDPESACASASWGLGQILGENFAAVHCDTARAMVAMMAASADAQIMAVAEFIQHENLSDELNLLNWAGFARGYNGKYYAKNHYDTKLAAAYKVLGPDSADGDALPAPRVAADGEVQHVLQQGEPQQKKPALAALDVAVTRVDRPAAPAIDSPGPVASGTSVQAVDAGDNPTKQPPKADTGTIDPAKVIDAKGKVKPLTGDETVRWAQQRLRDLGYFEVGVVDGLTGSRTTGAILAFEHDNGLALNPEIDDGLKLALINAKARTIEDDRANATVATLTPSSEILQATSRSKYIALFTALAGFLTTMISSLGEYLTSAKSDLAPFETMFAQIPGWVWGVVIFLLAVALYLQAHSIELNRLNMFKTGRAAS